MTRDRRWAIASVAAGLVLIGILLAVATGLVAPPISQDSDAINLATSELVPGMACNSALLEGDLVTHPLWVVAVEHDEQAEPLLILWPKGYAGRARGDQVEILDPDGEVVARTGDRISAGGGGRTIDDVEGFVMCPHGPTVMEDAPGYELTCGSVAMAECERRAAEFAADFHANPPPPRIVPPGTEIVSISLSGDTLDATLSNGVHISAGE